jgi:predicted anti-sigma-YlaC factor YlaD
MNCENTDALLTDRLKGLSSREADEALDAHVATCARCRAIAADTTALWERLGALDVEVPHERLRARFHASLAVHEARASHSWAERALDRWWPQQRLLQAGLAATLALLGVVVGQSLPSGTDTEVAALRAEVRAVGLALLNHQSASERLLGVEWSRRTAQGPEVIAALLANVQYDPNVNVRLAAVDALRARIDLPEVGAGLAVALGRQDSPLLQVAVSDILLATREAASIEAVRVLLGREALDPVVREYLEMALTDVDATATDI